MHHLRIPPVSSVASPLPLWRRTPFRQWLRIPRPWRMALVFLALLLTSNALLDSDWEIGIQSNSWGVLQQLHACERQSMVPDIVIMGSSRAQAGIAPPIISAQLGPQLGHHLIVCDMAVTTSVPLQDEYMLRQLYADGARPRMIVYAAADYAFNSPVALTNTPVRDNLEYLAHLSDLPELVQTRVTDPRNGPWDGTSWLLDFIAGRLVRAYADRKGLEAALCGLRPGFGVCRDLVPPPPPAAIPSTARPGIAYPIRRDLGWYPLPEMTQRSLQNSQAQYTAWLANYRVAPDALAALGRLVGMGRDHGAAIVLITTPILPRHLTFFPHPADYLTYLDALHTFATTHHIPFYDTSFGLDDDPADFADTNHLNYWGALSFTGWLTAHIIGPEWRRQVGP